MLSLLAAALVLGTALPPEGPSIALELKLVPEPSPRPGADVSLEKLMARSLEHADEADTVKTIVTIRARGEVLVNPNRVSLVLLEVSRPEVGARASDVRVQDRCVKVDKRAWEDSPEDDLVRLRRGEAISIRLTFDLRCYSLTPGEKVALAAQFEDGGYLSTPPSPEVTIAMRRVRSNILVLTYRGRKS